jgi:uncharacterized tellurite resistance protein B-like protein
MDQTKLIIIRAARDMARSDGRLHRNERKILRLIATAEQLSPEEKAALVSTSQPVNVAELKTLLPDPADRLRLFELNVLVGLADGVESPEEMDRLRAIRGSLGLNEPEVAGALERARERFFELTRLWEQEPEDDALGSAGL